MGRTHRHGDYVTSICHPGIWRISRFLGARRRYVRLTPADERSQSLATITSGGTIDTSVTDIRQLPKTVHPNQMELEL